ncbi:MAG: hypothetical protein GY715_06130 [Planctomycetes bacterium]|nr:hypothetical protein [Planctomycetota bacterium]
MNWRWLLLDFLPKGMNLDLAEKEAVRQQARQSVSFDGRDGMGTFVIAVVMIVPWLLVARWLMDQATVIGLPAIAPLPVILLGCWVIGVLAVGPVFARSTYRELRRRNHDVCVHCGHRWPDPAVATVVDPDENPDECPNCGNPRSR